MEVIERLMQYAGKVDAQTARKAGLLAPMFTLAEVIVIADHLVAEKARADALREQSVKALMRADEQTAAARLERDDAVTRAEISDAAARALGDDFTRVLRECAALKAQAEREANRAAEMEAQANREQKRADDLSVSLEASRFEVGAAERARDSMRGERDRAERARDEAVKDRLFVEGERDAARSEVEELRGHLKAANDAHMEAEAELKQTLAHLEEIRAATSDQLNVALDERDEANARAKKAEAHAADIVHAHNVVMDDMRDRLTTASTHVDDLTAVVDAYRADLAAAERARDDLREALDLALSVANDCAQRWSRGHPDRVAKATEVLNRTKPKEKP